MKIYSSTRETTNYEIAALVCRIVIHVTTGENTDSLSPAGQSLESISFIFSVARSFPCEAANLNHFVASSSFFSTPMP